MNNQNSKIKCYYYGHKLTEFFVSELTKDPFAIEFLEEGFNEIFRIPMFAIILKQMLENSDKLFTTEEFKTLIQKIKLSMDIIKELISDNEIKLMPFGYELNDKDSFDILNELLSYHGKNELVRFFNYIMQEILPKFLKVNNLVDELKHEVKEELSEEFNFNDFFNKLFSNLLLDVGQEQRIEHLISLYTHSFDNIMSFFFRPVGQETYDKLIEQKYVIENVKEKLPEYYDIFFKNMNYKLRNSLVHRNYFVDILTKEIIYYEWDNNMKKYIFKRLDVEEFSNIVYDLLTTSLSFFGSIYLQLLLWFSETFEGTLSILYLLELNVNDIITKLNKAVGFQIDTFLEISSTMKRKEELNSIMLEVRTLITAEEGILTTEDNKKLTKAQLISRFWKEFVKYKKDIVKNHEIIFGYGLYCFSKFKSSILKEYIDSYIGFLKRKKIKFNEQNLILESLISSRYLNPEISNILINEYQLEHMLSIRINQITDFALSESVRNRENNTIDEISMISEFYYNNMKELILSKSREISDELLKKLKELISITIIIKVLKDEDKPLTGSQLTLKVRRKEGFEDWPRPEFPTVKKCLEKAEKSGVVKIVKPPNSDFIIHISD